jgi:hybrid polyketide synthase/nonribosomal peptide synthetase ACE1
MDYRQTSAKLPLLDAQSWGRQLPGRTANDMILDISDVTGSEIRVNFKTQQYLYSGASTEILLKSFVQLVKTIVSNSKVQLDKLPLFGSLDIKVVMDIGRGESNCQFFDTCTDFSLGPNMVSECPATVSHRIEEVKLANHNSIALKDGEGNVLNYSAHGCTSRRDRLSSCRSWCTRRPSCGRIPGTHSGLDLLTSSHLEIRCSFRST